MFELKQYKETIDFIKSKVNFEAKYGIILGTGLSEMVDHIEIEYSLDYSDIPNFPISTVETHSGKLIFGKLAGKNIVAMQGRFHFYEGYTMQQVTFGVRIMKLLGIESLYISNVSGGLNSGYEIGDLMIIADHINLLPDNPLRGKNIDEFGPRFPDMLHAYSPTLIYQAEALAKENNIRIHKGVYVAVPGPNLETPAEYKFLHTIGADAVGMSTIPEVIVARHMNIPVFGISIITDLGVVGKIRKIEIPEIIRVANEAQPKMSLLIEQLINNN